MIANRELSQSCWNCSRLKKLRMPVMKRMRMLAKKHQYLFRNSCLLILILDFMNSSNTSALVVNPISCSSTQYRCSDGSGCISSSWACDGVLDCYDRSDETNCLSTTTSTSTSSTAPSSSRAPTTTAVSDGEHTNLVCRSDQFRCADGSLCISISWRCDQLPDCDDKSDESNCEPGVSASLFNSANTSPAAPLAPPSIPPSSPKSTFRPTPSISISSSSSSSSSSSISSSSNFINSSLSSRTSATISLSSIWKSNTPWTAVTQVAETTASIKTTPHLTFTPRATTRSPVPKSTPKLSNCTSTEFQCSDSGLCIPLFRVCNGFPDCKDRSDEDNCYDGSKMLENGVAVFKCLQGGQCISSAFYCDGHIDCQDMSDEIACYCDSVTKSTVRCTMGSSCVRIDQWCDGGGDCPDSSDEWNCTNVLCPKSSTRCNATKQCLRPEATCNGVPDCPDFSDEDNCPCPADRGFRCRTGNICVATEAWCNHSRECPDGSDEPVNCSTNCAPNQFRCQNGRCVGQYAVCNSANDCGDWSDEYNCTCASNQFRCTDGMCLNVNVYCNGKDDCRDGSDEPDNCAGTCPPGWLNCGGGNSCFNSKGLCDGIEDCMDGSDEMNCSSTCRGSFFSCDNNRLCLSMIYRCNGKIDCADMSDENNCSCTSNQFQCSMGMCVASTKRCDSKNDCGDWSDEDGCPCSRVQYQCQGDGHCISRDWLCDGVKDCPEGDDEVNSSCGTCRNDQFQCASDFSCLSVSRVCDGMPDCPDSSDEHHCFRFGAYNTSNSSSGSTHLVIARYRGDDWNVLCGDGWNQTASNMLCMEMGYSSALETTFNDLNSISPKYLVLTRLNVSSMLLKSVAVGSCNLLKAVNIRCTLQSCGARNVTSGVGQYIVNGDFALPGAWPWQAVLVYDQNTLCGGALLNERWIITAAHCVAGVDLSAPGTFNVSKEKVLLGTVNRDGSDPHSTPELAIDFARAHPLYDSESVEWDLALLRLSRPVQFTEFIQPICLPPPDLDLTQLKTCVATGFGRASYDSTPSVRLMQGRLSPLTDDQCVKQLSYYMSNGANELRNKSMFCAGSGSTFVSTCKGDSGGPLSCQTSQNTWVLAGLTSWGDPQCRVAVFARVTAALDWIRSVMDTFSTPPT